jgi:hypothetical protein
MQADFEPAAQGKMANETAQHGGMVGLLKSGERETSEQESFENWSVPQALGHGAHSAEDFAADWHRGKQWPPKSEFFLGVLFKEFWHYTRDAFPFGAFTNSYKNAALLIEQANRPQSEQIPFTFNPSGSGYLGDYQGATLNSLINLPK